MKDNRHEIVSEGYSRPHHYCDWSDVSMVKAMAMVEKGMSIRHASEMFKFQRVEQSYYTRFGGRGFANTTKGFLYELQCLLH